MIGVRIAQEISSSPSSYKDASIMDEYGDAGISSEVQQIISSEVEKAVESSQNQILSSMKILIDSNFKNFQSSMETTQKELSSSQLAKIEENIFGSYKFKRHGNEAQYRGNAQVITKLREADASLDSANLSVENINTARTKISEEIQITIQFQNKTIRIHACRRRSRTSALLTSSAFRQEFLTAGWGYSPTEGQSYCVWFLEPEGMQ
uniref:Uncharacterized protein n=1 Tax=Magallana gigas TaxID=29159 RepID=A0A8W8JNN1_MAGGI